MNLRHFTHSGFVLTCLLVLNWSDNLTAQNVIGWWRMESDTNAAGTNYSIPNEVGSGTPLTGATGQLQGSVPVAIIPQTGQANTMGLDGLANVAGSIASYPALNVDSITVEFWLRSTEGDAGIFSRSTGSNGQTFGTDGIVIADPDAVDIRYFVSNGVGGGTQVNFSDEFDTASQWHHMAFTYSSSSGVGSFYVDGVLQATNDGPDNRGLFWGGGTTGAILGTNFDGGGFNSNQSVVDELRIMDAALDFRLFLNSEPPVVVSTTSDPDRTFQGGATTLAFQDTRVGTSSSANIDVGNEVNTVPTAGVGLTTSGTGFSGSSPSAPLAGNSSISVPIAFAPNARSAFSGSSTVSSEFNPVTVALSGQGVGPVFAATLDPGGANTSLSGNGSETIDFGETQVGTPVDSDVIRIANNSTDALASTLDDLSVNAVITGSGAAEFEVFDANTMLPFTSTVLDSGQFIDLIVRFSGDNNGSFSASLDLLTDQNAPFGASGDDFSFNLVAAAVPEPASLACWSLLGLALISVGTYINRRRAN